PAAAYNAFIDAAHDLQDRQRNQGRTPQAAFRPSFTTPLERVGTDGELKHGTVGEWFSEYQVDTFGKMLSIDRRDLINDDLSVFDETARALGRAAMRRVIRFAEREAKQVSRFKSFPRGVVPSTDGDRAEPAHYQISEKRTAEL